MKQTKFGSLVVQTVMALAIMFGAGQTALAADSQTQAQIGLIEIPQDINGHKILAQDFLSELYQLRGQGLIWKQKAHKDALKSALAASWKDGLNPADFHAEIIASDGQGLSAPQYDIILSDALIRMLYQLQNGKIDPETLDHNWNYQEVLAVPNAVTIVNDHLAKQDLDGLIAEARPHSKAYTKMTQALQSYKAEVDKGNWQAIPDGPTIHPGDRDERVPTIRARLNLPAVSGSDATLFDPELEAAVKAFQSARHLKVDGVIGKGTLGMMDMSPSEKMDRIRVNMERLKWISKSLNFDEDMIVVNIAGYELGLLQDGSQVWNTRVIVGKSYTKTPVFTGDMRYVEFNPTWTIPYSIVRNSIIPGLRKDPDYLNKKGYVLYDRSGALVDPSTLDISTIGSSFPYTVVQPPGPKNALGQVKFIFPNKHNVYLHDTPSRSLFDRDERAFSHGCVRVQDPLTMAEYVLKDKPGWGRDKIDETVASKKQTRVNLDTPLKVAILYWTADALGDGDIRFHNDIYDRDPTVLAALNAPWAP